MKSRKAVPSRAACKGSWACSRERPMHTEITDKTPLTWVEVKTRLNNFLRMLLILTILFLSLLGSVEALIGVRILTYSKRSIRERTQHSQREAIMGTHLFRWVKKTPQETHWSRIHSSMMSRLRMSQMKILMTSELKVIFAVLRSKKTNKKRISREWHSND